MAASGSGGGRQPSLRPVLHFRDCSGTEHGAVAAAVAFGVHQAGGGSGSGGGSDGGEAAAPARGGRGRCLAVALGLAALVAGAMGTRMFLTSGTADTHDVAGGHDATVLQDRQLHVNDVGLGEAVVEADVAAPASHEDVPAPPASEPATDSGDEQLTPPLPPLPLKVPVSPLEPAHAAPPPPPPPVVEQPQPIAEEEVQVESPSELDNAPRELGGAADVLQAEVEAAPPAAAPSSGGSLTIGAIALVVLLAAGAVMWARVQGSKSSATAASAGGGTVAPAAVAAPPPPPQSPAEPAAEAPAAEPEAPSTAAATVATGNASLVHRRAPTNFEGTRRASGVTALDNAAVTTGAAWNALSAGAGAAAAAVPAGGEHDAGSVAAGGGEAAGAHDRRAAVYPTVVVTAKGPVAPEAPTT